MILDLVLNFLLGRYLGTMIILFGNLNYLIVALFQFFHIIQARTETPKILIVSGEQRLLKVFKNYS